MQVKHERVKLIGVFRIGYRCGVSYIRLPLTFRYPLIWKRTIANKLQGRRLMCCWPAFKYWIYNRKGSRNGHDDEDDDDDGQYKR